MPLVFSPGVNTSKLSCAMVQVLQYLLDDVSDFLRTQTNTVEGENNCIKEGKGCANVLKTFIDYISERETENFRARRLENKDSVTLTTIHQVFPFILKATYHFLLEFHS